VHKINNSRSKAKSNVKSNAHKIKEKGSKIACLNVTSLPKYLDEIRLLLFDREFEILALNQTRLDDSIQNGTVDIDGYDIVRLDRNRFGGGVCFYVRNSINYIVRDDLLTKELEILTLEIRKPFTKPFLITTWYRPPNLSRDCLSTLEQYLIKLDSEEKESLLLGDFNCDILHNPLSALTKDVTFLLESYQYTQLINEATRITQSSKTLIDHIYSNTTHMVNSSGVLHIGISDHSLNYCVSKFPSFKTSKRGKTIKYRCLKKFNLNLFLADLERVPWNNIFNFDDPNSMCTTWKSMFMTFTHP
jgi:exonuclease III